jgi:ribosomal protein L37E
MTDLVNEKNSFIIDSCNFCGAEYYHTMAECAVCGNKILDASRVDKETWDRCKEDHFKKQVEAFLK